MKKEDLTKLLIEEKPDLSPVSHNILFFLLLFSFGLLTAQVNTNGFFNVDEIEVLTEFNRIFDLDFDNDKLIDLLLVNKSNKEYSLVRNLFTKNQRIINKKFWINLNSIIKFKEENKTNYYLLASRKDKSVSLVYFTNYGSLIIKQSLGLNSYPSKLFSAGFNNNGRISAVVYGPSFNGISLITEKNFKLSEEKITDSESYSEAFSNDFNGDFFLDIAALNSKKNSLEIFANDQEGSFYYDRKFNFGNKEIFQIFTDINNDDFSDLITTRGKEINIYYGDSVYSFKNKVQYNFDIPIKKIIAADINYNNVKDLIFINETGSKIFLSLSNAENKYQKPFCVLNGKSLEDIQITRKGILNRLLAVDSAGKLYSISYAGSRGSSFRISLSDSLTNIFSIENLLGAVSPNENKLYLIRNENSSLAYYDYKISYPFSNILIDTLKTGFNFYFYNKSQKLVEILELDSALTIKKRSNFYFNKKITTLSKNYTSNEITAVLKENNSLYIKSLTDYQKDKFSKITDDYLVTSNVVKADAASSDTTYITFISNLKGELYYNLSIKNKMFYRDSVKVKIGISENDVKLKSFIRNGEFFAITNIDSTIEYLVHTKNELKKYNSDFQFDPEKLKITAFRNRDRFLYLDEKNNELNWIKISTSKSQFIKETLLKNIYAKDFTFFLYNDILMIVYFDTQTKLLNFRRISFND